MKIVASEKREMIIVSVVGGTVQEESLQKGRIRGGLHSRTVKDQTGLRKT
jgi:hypothetical protein